ncbi:hypothetical protein BN946_scf184962.g85 [Trametes cinnabarina]|uniref:Uncharacterized protein n=1 Tax=Pycnoporus cinnabarinus TaxID=5643 RepID=A0A060SCA9_PYCCI|nr:hypothetical protein BN946_scf184962.g85 [Trametes cinnabarina]
MSSPRTALSAATTNYDAADNSANYKYPRCTKFQRPRAGDSNEQSELGSTAYFRSEGDLRLESAGEASECQNLCIGDVFCHTISSFDPPHYQLWLRESKGRDGACWKQVYTGYQRHDGRKLILTHNKREPSWVLTGWYKRWLKEEYKLLDEERRKGHKDACIPGARK